MDFLTKNYMLTLIFAFNTFYQNETIKLTTDDDNERNNKNIRLVFV